MVNTLPNTNKDNRKNLFSSIRISKTMSLVKKEEEKTTPLMEKILKNKNIETDKMGLLLDRFKSS